MKREKLLLSIRAWWKERTAYFVAFPILLKWLLIATGIGILVGGVGSLFAHVLGFVNGLRGQFPLIALGLPIGGLAIVFLYRVTKNHDDRGTNTIVASIQESSEIPFKMAPLIFVSTTITHLFGFEGMPYYLVTIAISYMISGYHSLYHKQKIVYSKTKTQYITREEDQLTVEAVAAEDA